MSERYHVIITGESGRSSSFQLSKKRFYQATAVLLVLFVATLVFGYLTTGSYLNSRLQTHKAEQLQERLEKRDAERTALKKQLDALVRERDTRISNLTREHENQIKSLTSRYETQIKTLAEQHETALATQRMQYDLENTTLQLENIRLMTTAVNDLNQRSELIETVMGTIGIEIKPPEKDTVTMANSGGPYIPDTSQSYNELVQKVDTYLKTIKKIPLGKPVDGSLSSKFGKRSDPLNKKKAIHEGVDLRGDRGDKIYATAGGTVIKAFKNGGYGNYVEIDHGNGYRTIYAHLQNYLVKKGEVVEQGQVIGQVGSTGRSTGPHLHYEILLNNKPIDPKKFLQVADISHTFTSSKE